MAILPCVVAADGERDGIPIFLTEAMALDEGQSEPFWQIYRDYDYELSSIVDQRIALIKDYAENWENMTQDKAAEIMKRTIRIMSMTLLMAFNTLLRSPETKSMILGVASPS